MRIWLTVGNNFALGNLLTFEHIQVTPLRNQLLMTLARLFGDY